MYIYIYIYKEGCVYIRICITYIKRGFLADGDYSNISNCRTKILAIFRGIFIIFCGISKYLCIYSSISIGTPNDVLCNPKVPRNPVWETLLSPVFLQLTVRICHRCLSQYVNFLSSILEHLACGFKYHSRYECISAFFRCVVMCRQRSCDEPIILSSKNY